METVERIKQQIADHKIILYMKGTPEQPMCGFSARAVEALSACKAKFAYINILENPDIRQELPKYANWPTFPQLYVNGDLVGGCDIITELHRNGELQQLLKTAV